MRWQTFFSNFWKSIIIKAFAFTSIFPFDRNFFKEGKDIAKKVSPQTWTTAVFRCEFITHEFWDFSSWNKQRLNNNMLSWCNQTQRLLLIGNSADVTSVPGYVFFTAEQDVFWHDHQIPPKCSNSVWWLYSSADILM